MPTAANRPEAPMVIMALTDMLLSRAMVNSISSHGISVVSAEIFAPFRAEMIPEGSLNVIDTSGSLPSFRRSRRRRSGCRPSLVVRMVRTSPGGRRDTPGCTRMPRTPSRDSRFRTSGSVRPVGTVMSMLRAMLLPVAGNVPPLWSAACKCRLSSSCRGFGRCPALAWSGGRSSQDLERLSRMPVAQLPAQGRAARSPPPSKFFICTISSRTASSRIPLSVRMVPATDRSSRRRPSSRCSGSM